MQQISEKIEPPSPPPLTPPPVKNSNHLVDKISEELVKGRDTVNELRRLLNARFLKDDLIEGFSTIIESSFSNCLLLLNDVEYLKSFKSTNTLPDSKFEDSGESSKNSMAKDRRGCYKRRKTCQSWTVDTPTQSADTYAWRKYGQKDILNAKHPRNYYRCTHKIDQGCLATKQVQQIAEDPPLFRTTYSGHHTCTSLLKAPQIILDRADKSESSIKLISFESNNPSPAGQDVINPFSTSFPNMIKQEDGRPRITEAENMMMMTTQNQNHSSPFSDYLSSSDPTTLESSGPIVGSDHGDVISGAYSCTASSPNSLDIDNYSYLMVGCMDDFDKIREMLQF
ncbi:hypothetical protein Ancab_031376 [Ancistrocladus abbreviatus]